LPVRIRSRRALTLPSRSIAQNGARSAFNAGRVAERNVQMRLELCRSHLEILPEGEADLAYIEDTLGLMHAGKQIPLIRLEYRSGRANAVRLAAGNNLRAPQLRGK
jgi:hypothetical protein